MYYLKTEADSLSATAEALETRHLDLFQRYLQGTEEVADLLAKHLAELLTADCRKSHTEVFWRNALSRAAEFLAEEESITLHGIAPAGYELLIPCYNLYSAACAQTVDAIYEFLDGVGQVAGIHTAFLALQKTNSTRRLYLKVMNLPGWSNDTRQDPRPSEPAAGSARARQSSTR